MLCGCLHQSRFERTVLLQSCRRGLAQQAQSFPLLAFDKFWLLSVSVSGKYISSSAGCCLRARRAISWKASSTFVASFALVSWYGMSFFDLHQFCAFKAGTFRFVSRSALLPITTKGKLSGSRGDVCIRNSSRQLSMDSKVFDSVRSKTKAQQSAPR